MSASGRRETVLARGTCAAGAALALAHAVLVAGNVLPGPARVLALPALAFLPGLGLAVLFGPRRRSLPELVAGAVLAAPLPLLLAGLVTGGAGTRAVLVVDLVALAGLLAGGMRLRAVSAGRARGEHVFGLALGGLVAAGALASGSFLVSYHGLAHAAIARAILRDGIPPENPYFAGERLHYYWGFHLAGAVLARGLGIDPLRALNLLRVLAAAAAPVALARLARQVTRRRMPGWLPAVAGYSGLNALGWVFLLPLVPALLAGGPPERPLSLLGAMAPGFNRRVAAGWTIVLNLSGFGPGLVLGLAGAGLLLAPAAAGRRRLPAGSAFLLASFLVNPLAGGAALLGILGMLAGRSLAAGPWRSAAGPGLAAGAAAILAVPYVHSLAAGETRTLVRPVLEGWRLWQLVAVLGPLAVLALAGRRPGRALRERAAPLGGAILLAFAGTFLELPARDDYYFLRAAALVLAPAAAAGLVALSGRRRGLALAAGLLLLVPQGAVTLFAYAAAAAHPVPVACRGTAIDLLPVDRDPGAAWRALREGAGPGALVLEAFDPVQCSLGPAQGSDAAAFGEARLWLGYGSGVGKRTGGMFLGGYADLPRRRDLLARVFSGTMRPRRLHRLLAGIGRQAGGALPVLVVRPSRPGDRRLLETLRTRPDLFREVHGGPGVYLWEPVPRAPGAATEEFPR